MRKCFILCRQSAVDGDSSLSIESQEDECRKLCHKEDINIVDVFKEPGFSGRLYPVGYENLAATDFVFKEFVKGTRKVSQFRPGLGEILKRMKEVDLVVCYDLTRLMRPLNGSFLSPIITQQFVQHNVKLMTVKEGLIDFNSFQDTLISDLTSHINSEQLLIQRKKAMEAKKKQRDRGENPEGIYHMRGYEYISKKFGVKIIPEEAEGIRFVVNSFLEGKNLATTAKEVFKKFPCLYKNRRGSVGVNGTRLLQQLINPIYAGYTFNSDGVLVECKMTKGKEIYSLDTYLKLKKHLEARKKASSRMKLNFYPISKKIFCGVCGETMTAVGSTVWNGVRFFRYICSSYKSFNGSSHCGTNIRCHIDSEEGLCLNSAIKPLLIAEVLRRMENTIKNDDDALILENIEMKLNALKQKEEKLTEMFMEDLLSEAALQARLQAIKNEREELSNTKANMLAPSEKNSPTDCVRLLVKFKKNEVSDQEYLDLAKDFIQRVDAYKDSVKVKTSLGTVELPRQHIHRSNAICFFVLGMEIAVDKGIVGEFNAEMTFYKGLKRKITLEEMVKARRLTGVLGKFKIYVME